MAGNAEFGLQRKAGSKLEMKLSGNTANCGESCINSWLFLRQRCIHHILVSGRISYACLQTPQTGGLFGQRAGFNQP